MSIQVLSARPGWHYNHSFLDDLQSFFWLMLWCVAAHLEPGEAEPTEEALRTLNALDRPDLEDMASRKSTLLRDCYRDGGAEMRYKLNSFQNTWASDPAITSTILSLGRFFHKIENRDISPDQPTTVAFPFVVSIMLDALGESLPEGFSDHRNMQFS
jgi:hypothetical protein